MHVYVREERREGQRLERDRERENSIYIFIVYHALQLMSKYVEKG